MITSYKDYSTETRTVNFLPFTFKFSFPYPELDQIFSFYFTAKLILIYIIGVVQIGVD